MESNKEKKPLHQQEEKKLTFEERYKKPKKEY